MVYHLAPFRIYGDLKPKIANVHTPFSFNATSGSVNPIEFRDKSDLEKLESSGYLSVMLYSFVRFDTKPACDGHGRTQGQADTNSAVRSIYSTLCSILRRKIKKMRLSYFTEHTQCFANHNDITVR